MGYMAAHDRNRRAFGKASEYRCDHCDQPAQEWALAHDQEPDGVKRDRFGAYSDDPADYIPLCKPCHQTFDKALITHCPHGHPYEGRNLMIEAGKRKCRTCVYARNNARRLRNPMTPEQKARKLELQRIRRAAAKAGES